MSRYLDPKNDLLFKKVFVENSDLLLRFLNALLPLDEGQQIESLEYLNNEMVPNNPFRKESIVDVHCRDRRGRQFIVEMKNYRHEYFPYRMLFNAAKAYVQQLDHGEKYDLLVPVYALGLLNSVIPNQPAANSFYHLYHHYKMVAAGSENDVIDGLQLVLVELPRYAPEKLPAKLRDRRLADLWLRFFARD
jgi:predicted transposase/invertase (TIGR01784 family)